MKYEVTKFGVTKMVDGYVTKDGTVYDQQHYDILMFVERPEDYYALSCSNIKTNMFWLLTLKISGTLDFHQNV